MGSLNYAIKPILQYRLEISRIMPRIFTLEAITSLCSLVIHSHFGTVHMCIHPSLKFLPRRYMYTHYFQSLNYSAQAFHGAFEDFVTWLRETERKIQRDDPLKLEDGELQLGLKLLKVAISRL